MEIRIPIHSFIDLITNSSTEIYIGTKEKTIEYAKEMIDKFLAEAGSDKKADDLFTFEQCDDVDKRDYPDDYSDDDDWYDRIPRGELVIKSKASGKVVTELVGQLRTIFSLDARYDG